MAIPEGARDDIDAITMRLYEPLRRLPQMLTTFVTTALLLHHHTVESQSLMNYHFTPPSAPCQSCPLPAFAIILIMVVHQCDACRKPIADTEEAASYISAETGRPSSSARCAPNRSRASSWATNSSP